MSRFLTLYAARWLYFGPPGLYINIFGYSRNPTQFYGGKKNLDSFHIRTRPLADLVLSKLLFQNLARRLKFLYRFPKQFRKILYGYTYQYLD